MKPETSPIPDWTRPLRFLVTLTLLLPLTQVVAFESYHDPTQNDAGYCATCHSGFGGGRSDTLHALHTGGSDPMTSQCDLCHTGAGRDNPLIMWSTLNSGNGLGCMGCHGRDYGETVAADYRGFTITGKAKNSGYGLRLHHAMNGIGLCAGCHDDSGVTPYPENVINPGLGNTEHYFFRGDVSLGGNPIDTCINEDTGNDMDTTGLDNDGDNLYDRDDPDCVSEELFLAIQRTATNTLVIQWPAPAENWMLQENSQVGAGTWMNLPTPTLRVNGSWRLVVDPQPDPNFYRLLRP